jgi:geranylgeranylglycerol-phosphate geranylgeranyltransferase
MKTFKEFTDEKKLVSTNKGNNRKNNYPALKINEDNNRFISTIILTLTIGVFATLFINLLDIFNKRSYPIKEVFIFIFLIILVIQCLFFYYKLIIKMRESFMGNLFTIILSVIPIIFIIITIKIIPLFTFVGIGMAFICLKSGDLFRFAKSEQILNETKKYFKRIFLFYILLSVIIISIGVLVDSGYAPFFPKYEKNLNIIIIRNEIINQKLSSEKVEIALNNLNYTIESITGIKDTIIGASIISVFLIIPFIGYKFILIRNIKLNNVLSELETYYNENQFDSPPSEHKIINNIKSFLTIIRPFVSSISGFIATVVYFQTTNKFQIQPAIFLFFIVFLTTAYGFVLNDYFDIEKDKIDHKNRPLPSGKISPKNALLLSVLFATLSLFFSIFIGIEGLIINILTISLLGIYSKINNKYGVLANIITATISSFVLIIGMSVGSFSWIIFYLSFATFFLILGREIILDIRDLNSDRAIGKESYPLKHGIKKSVNMAILLFSITSLILLVTSAITNSLGFFIILGIIANLMLWVSIINYRKSYDNVKLERFLLISRIAFILIIPALFFIK